MSSTTRPQANMRLGIVVLTITLAGTACGGDGSSLDSAPNPEATQLAFTVEPSSAVAGQTITPAIQVSIRDAAGALFSTGDSPITLALALHPSNGTLTGTTTVNAHGGVASFSDLQINRPGAGFVLSASAPGLTGAISMAFDISPVPGVPVTIALAGGNGQTTMVGQPVAINPSVRVSDGLGNPIANVGITFSVTGGGGSGTGLDQITDGTGLATVGQWTLGTTPVVNTMVATSPDVAGSSATFTASATAGPATDLSKFAGDEQITRSGTSVAQPPSVLVTDVYGNPVAEVPVTFSVGAGGGRIAGAAQTSGQDGVAAVGSWTLGNHLGRNTLNAASPGLKGSPATFTATAINVSAVVEVRNNYFRSPKNGSGSGDNVFGYGAVDTIPVGGSVLWQWAGQNHNVSVFEESGIHSAPFTYGPIIFNTRGTYRYHCTIHSQVIEYLGLVGMRGEIVVR